jgi:hypothetical protein
MVIFEEGILREIIIGFYYIQIAFTSQLLVLMGRNIVKGLKEKFPIKLILSFFIFFVGYIIQSIIYLIADFYPCDRDFILKISYTITLTGVIPLIKAFEEYISFDTRGFFWKSGLILAVLTVILSKEISRILTSISLPIIYFPFSILVPYQIVKGKRGPATRSGYLLLAGTLISYIGEFFRTDLMVSNYGSIMYLIGSTITIVGIIFFGISSLSLRSLEELEWPSAVQQLIILTKEEGNLLYSHSFIKKVSKEILMNEKLIVAGGFSGVTKLLKEISSSSKDIRYIDKGDTNFLFVHGKYIVGILLSKSFLEIVYWKLNWIVQKTESTYDHILENFSGDISLFNSINSIVKNQFA